MTILTIKLNKKAIARIRDLAEIMKKDKSTVARELIDLGWEYLMFKAYKNGELSLGTLSESLDLSMSETIDRLTEFGVSAPIEYHDYLRGFEYLRGWKTRG